LLGRAGRRTVRVNAVDVPLATYLRGLSRLAWEAAEHSLAETGETAAEVEAEFETLRARQRAPNLVRWLQSALNQVDQANLKVDGRTGPSTRAAVVRFQRRHGLRADGVAGPATRAALVAAGAPAPAGVSAAEPGGCPPDRPDVVRGFRQYSPSTSLLPPEQKDKLAAIARDIAGSQGGPTPVDRVMLEGHADLDPEREAQEPGFMQRISEERAKAVSADLQGQVGPSVAGAVAWLPSGRGATDLDVRSPQNDTEHACNRRVKVTLLRTAPPPPPPSSVTFRIAAKSFIGHIGSAVGTAPCGTVANIKLHAFATATDIAFSENPTSAGRFVAPPVASEI
jgi:outer membrane protein OmpA-like peptidoglycan-associated protein